MTLTEDRFTIHDPNAAKLSWQVPVQIGAVGGHVPRTVLVGDKPETVVFPGCDKPVQANYGDVGYYRVDYDEASLKALINDYKNLPPSNRAVLVADQWAMVQAGRADASLYLDLTKALGGETERVVWSSVINALEEIDRLERVDGEIDTLVQRIAHIRTWTYITHRPGWLDDSAHWQERALAIEDRLSDALHDRLTQRFVDRRAASLVRYLAEARDLLAAVSAAGEVLVEGHYLGRMKGFRFVADQAADGESARALLAAANRVLRREVTTRAKRLAADPDGAFMLDPAGTIAWHGETIARLLPGDTLLAPRVEVLAADFLDGALRDLVRRRLDDVVRGTVEQGLKPLFTAQTLPVGAAARGLLFRLGETLGTLDTVEAAPLTAGLTAEDRRALTRAGVRFGTETIHVAALLKPAAIGLRVLLCSIRAGAALPTPPAGRVAVPAEMVARDHADAIGYRIIGPVAIRVDRLERLTAALRRSAQAPGGFVLEPEWASSLGVKLGDLPAIVAALGYRGVAQEDGPLRFVPLPRRARRNGAGRRPPAVKPGDADHPFAKLKELEFGR